MEDYVESVKDDSLKIASQDTETGTEKNTEKEKTEKKQSRASSRQSKNKVGRLVGFRCLLFIILSFVMVGSGIITLVSEEAGIYIDRKEDVISRYDEMIMKRYAICALMNRDNQYGFDELKDTSFRYGIIRTNKFYSSMAWDIDNYEFYCFDNDFEEKVKHPDEWYAFSTNLNENTFIYYEPYLFGHSYISNGSSSFGGNPRQVKYYVISYRSEHSKLSPVFEENDFFGQLRILVNLAYEIRYWNVGVFVISLFIEIILLISLYKSFVKRGRSDKDSNEGTKKLPLDLSFVLSFVTISIIVSLLIEYVISLRRFGIGMFRSPLLWVFVILGGVLCDVLLIAWVSSFAYQISQKGILESTLCGKLIRLFAGFVCRFFKGIGKIIGKSSFKTAFLILLPVFALEQIIIMIIGTRSTILMALAVIIELITVIVIAIIIVPVLESILQAGKELAEGNIDYRLETGDMPGQFKSHAENLNSIGSVLNSAVEERIKSETFKTQLITNVSHDIKTPLTSIINYVDLLEKEKLDNENAVEYLEIIERQSAKLKKLIEDLIEASKASSGSLKVEKTKLDASVILTQVAGEFLDKCEASGIELVISSPEEQVLIEADGRHLWRVFDNLLNNICKYAMPGTRAYIDIEKDDEYTSIVFKNISRESLNISSEALLERFVRADVSRHTEGNGLGLSIAQSLMELMGARLLLTVDGDLFKVSLVFENSEENGEVSE